MKTRTGKPFAVTSPFLIGYEMKGTTKDQLIQYQYITEERAMKELKACFVTIRFWAETGKIDARQLSNGEWIYKKDAVKRFVRPAMDWGELFAWWLPWIRRMHS